MDYLFIISDSRSGSTLLSKLLSRAGGSILVLPEFRVDRLSDLYCSRNTPSTFQTKLDKIFFKNNDLKNLKLENLVPIANDQNLGGSFSSLLDQIVSSYIEQHALPKPDVVVIKKGNHYNVIQQLSEQLSGVRFIFLVRDPRGVYTSKCEAVMPRFPSQTMGWKGPILSAMDWSKIERVATKQLQRLAGYMIVKYEDLAEQSITCETLLSGLNLSLPQARDAETSLAFEPPEDQAHLHGNISKAPSTSIAQAWKNKIESCDSIIIEYLLSKKLNDYEYPLLHETTPWHSRFGFVLLEVFRVPVRFLSHALIRLRVKK